MKSVMLASATRSAPGVHSRSPSRTSPSRFTRPTLQPAEGAGVAERSAQGAVPGGERADLEVLRPAGAGWQDAEALGGQEAEPAVVAGIAEQEDGWLVQRVGGGQDAVHECQPDAPPLVAGQHAERAQAGRGAAVDAATAADHMPDDLVTGRGGQREAGDHAAVI